MGKEKTRTVFETVISNLNGRDTVTFIAEKYKVQPDGFVKMEGHFKRERKTNVIYVPLTSIAYMEEDEEDIEEAEAKEEKEEV